MKIGLNIALSLSVEQHPVYFAFSSMMLFGIYYNIGVNLVKVAGQYGLLIKILVSGKTFMSQLIF